MGIQEKGKIIFREVKTRTLDECFYKTLFNHPKHIQLQSKEALSFLLFVGEECCGVFHCVIEGKEAFSPFRSLFGGFETGKNVGEDELRPFISYTLKRLKKKGVDKINITLPANFSRKSKIKQQRKILQESGFKKVVKLKNHHIEIQDKTLSPLLHEMEKRKLKKCNKEGLEFYQEPVDLLSLAYNFISVCRKEKNQPLNISLEMLQKSFEVFPDHYFIFSTKLNNEFFAVTIAVKVNENILYNFLPASPSRFNYLSPMVKLIDGLYGFARKKGYKFLDLGVSTTRDGKHQDSLLQFKKHMGGISSSKVVLQKAF